VLIVPGFGDDRCAEVSAHPDCIPWELGGRRLKYRREDGGEIPCRFPRPFTRKASSTSTRNLRVLHELNSLGMDIYFAVNPLTCSRRCQKTVRLARHIVLECDDPDFSVEDQRLGIALLKPCCSAALYSGNHSIHAYLRLVPPLWNTAAVGWRAAQYLKDTRLDWPDYDRLARHWIRMFGLCGVELDSRTARDSSRISRLPGFTHSGSGRVSEVEFLNPGCIGWDPRKILNPPSWDPGDDPPDDVLEAARAEMEERLPQEISPSSDQTPVIHARESISLSHKSMSMEQCSSHSSVSPSCASPSYPCSPKCSGGILGMTNVRETSKDNGKKSTFLDDLRTWDEICLNGIPKRHMRRKLHRVLFTAARVYEWNEEEMAVEWLSVASVAPSNIGHDVDPVKDMLKDWGAVRDCGWRPYLPDLTQLPDMTDERKGLLTTALSCRGCPCPLQAGRLLSRVVWPRLKQNPAQCILGTAGLHARDMRAACDMGGQNRSHLPSLEWLTESRVLTCTVEAYEIARQTRLWRVNVPLLLFFAGFKPEELVWSQASTSNRRLKDGDTPAQTKLRGNPSSQGTHMEDDSPGG